MGRLESNITASHKTAKMRRNERQRYIDGYIFYFYASFLLPLLCRLTPLPPPHPSSCQPAHFEIDYFAMAATTAAAAAASECELEEMYIKLYYSIIHRFNLSLYGH
jgi:hypothetical protein